MRIYFGVVLAAVVFLGSCSKAPELTSGVDLQGMDKSVAPGDEFNLYANGAWVKATPIPPDKSSYGVGTIVSDKTRKQLQDLIQNAGGKIGDYYAAFMDEAAIEAKHKSHMTVEVVPIASEPNIEIANTPLTEMLAEMSTEISLEASLQEEMEMVKAE